MKTTKRAALSLLAHACIASAALAAGSGCGPLQLGEEAPRRSAELTLLGDRNIYVANGDRVELRVRYHDGSGEPLAGIVDFELHGDTRGAKLLSPAVTTDSSGTAAVTLDALASDQTSFYVTASAVDADEVEWSVTIERPQPPLNPAGVYEIDSTFDVVSGMQESALSDAIRGVLDFSREPGSYILRTAADEGFITQEEAESRGPDLTAVLRDEAPDEHETLRQLGAHFADVSREFGVVSTLEIGGDRDAPSAEHRITALVVTVDEERYPLSLGDLGVESVEPQRVSVSVGADENRIRLEEHALAVPYGTMLELAIQRIIVAALDEDADNLASFLHDQIPCVPVADWLVVEFGMEPIVADGVCRDSVTAATEEVLDQILILDEDEGLDLVIAGSARFVDTDGDGTPDVLLDGSWQGALEHAGAPAARLDAERNEFSAERIETTTE